MAEKDVKAAKKLYAKMKKAQKAQNKQDSPAPENGPEATDVKATDIKSGDDTSKEQTPSSEKTSSNDAADASNVDDKDTISGEKAGSAEPEPEESKDSEAQEATDKDSKSIPGEEGEDKKDYDQAGEDHGDKQPEVHQKEAESAATETPDKGSEKVLEPELAVSPEPPIETNEQLESKDGETQSGEAVSETAHSEADAKGTDKTSPIAPEPETSSNEPAAKDQPESNNSVGAPGQARDDSSAEIIADLRGENDSLKAQVKKLENKVRSLESELSALKHLHTEVSLSPPSFPQDDKQIQAHRVRASSFVEADLYSESERVNERREQMKKWKGYQLDLRSWRRPSGIGKIVQI